MHVHHLVFGIVAILVAGLFALDEALRLTRRVLFGIGAALVLDEFALLVFLRDVYWLPQGSLSVFALVIGLRPLPSTPGAAGRSSGRSWGTSGGGHDPAWRPIVDGGPARHP